MAYTKPDADGAKDEKGNLLVKKTWYCLLATAISFNVPQGYDAGDDSISVSKGRVRVSITAQNESIGNAKTNERSATWRVVGNDYSPKNTVTSKSVYVDAGCNQDVFFDSTRALTSDRSNSVSTDIGADVGFFGETRKRFCWPPALKALNVDHPKAQGGVGFSKSFSNTLSETIADCEIVANQEDLRRTSFRVFDYSGMDDSPAAKSGFNVTFQSMWSFSSTLPEKEQPLTGENQVVLDKMAFKIKINWEPRITEKFGPRAVEPARFADAAVFVWNVDWHGTEVPQTAL